MTYFSVAAISAAAAAAVYEVLQASPQPNPESANHNQDMAKLLHQRLSSGDRLSLSKAITLVESTRADHRSMSNQLLTLLSTTTAACQSQRIGVSGAPGVGKSTFLEALGMHILSQSPAAQSPSPSHNPRLAILAIDPSSQISGGSILGDKTRMPQLAAREDVFIRPSPNSQELGGIARSTYESLLLCEAAGYQTVFVESVGVGQSETLLASITDLFLLLIQPGSGDELQGLKKGIVEIADLVVINKADGDMKAAANLTMAEYVAAMKLLGSGGAATRGGCGWKPRVLKCSSTTGQGIPEVWNSIQEYYALASSSSFLLQKRANQRVKAMWRLLASNLIQDLKADPGVKALVVDLEKAVERGNVQPGVASDLIISEYVGRRKA